MTYKHWSRKITLLITVGLALEFSRNCLASEANVTEAPFYRTYVEKSVVYHETEWADKIPREKEFVITEGTSKRQQTVKLPQLWVEYGDYVWKDGFEFPIVVENWDADYYMLGDEAIPQKEEEPFSGYEELLLKYLGLPSSHYIISATHWDGIAYEEQGIWYRKAVAEGKKLVADASVCYGGEVIWQMEPGLSLEDEIQSPEEELTETSQAAETEQVFDQEHYSLADLLRRIVTTLWMMKISILFVLFLLLCVYILARHLKKGRSRKNED